MGNLSSMMLVGIRVICAIAIIWIVCAVGVIGIIWVGIICAIGPSRAAGMTYVAAIPTTATNTARTSDTSTTTYSSATTTWLRLLRRAARTS